MSPNAVKVPVLALSVVILSGGCGPLETEELEPDSSETNGELQAVYVNLNSYYAVGPKGDDALARATGSMWTSEGTCGLTFISKHYAITAGHCVTGETSPITVSTYETTNLSPLRISAQATVDKSGGWPKWRMPTRLGAADNYNVSSFLCAVVRNCHSSPTVSCPTTTGTDIAMLFCPLRPVARQGWMPVWGETHAPETTATNLRLRWYHEIVALSTTQGQSQDWLHYGMYDDKTHLKENFHYSFKHQLIPLDTYSPNAGSKRILAVGSTLVDTNIAVCHGTSGSGAVSEVNGVPYLLGPMKTGNNTTTVLCQPANGTPVSSYVRSGYATPFGKLTEVRSDR